MSFYGIYGIACVLQFMTSFFLGILVTAAPCNQCILQSIAVRVSLNLDLDSFLESIEYDFTVA